VVAASGDRLESVQRWIGAVRPMLPV
jgi:hypothetical protein